MYNEPQKLLYIESYLKSSNIRNKEARHKSMCNFFNRIQEPEVQLDKDFAVFNYEETKMALAIICRRSLRYQKSVLSELRGYVEWCIDNGRSLDCENRLIGITAGDISVIASYKMNMFKNEAELNSALDKILTPIQEDTSNNILRAILHLVFNGVSYGEVFNIRSGQVDFESSVIRLRGRDIAMSDLCRDILKYVMRMSEFFEAPKFGTGSSVATGDPIKTAGRRYDIFKNGYAIENSKENRASMQATYAPIISKAFAALKATKGDVLTITIGDIITSGVFSRIYEKERTTGELDFTEYSIIAKNDDKKEYWLTTSERDMKIQYAGWKESFGLLAND